eukprot:scaffold26631_cov139-Skeletonema_menzelii.AAC.13
MPRPCCRALGCALVALDEDAAYGWIYGAKDETEFEILLAYDGREWIALLLPPAWRIFFVHVQVDMIESILASR